MGDDLEIMEIETAAAAFVLGRGGSTKRKIERVSETRMDLDERRGTIEIRGTPAQRQKARDYVNFVDMQRRGSVEVNTATRNDITVVAVPEDCCGFVMGKGSNMLRSIEEEWSTLMCFAKVDDREELLCIFGNFSNRRGAELEVMAVLERNKPGYYVDREELLFTTRAANDVDDEGWAVDTEMLHEDEFLYAFGANHNFRLKLTKASGTSSTCEALRVRVASCALSDAMPPLSPCVQAASSSVSVALPAWQATARSASVPGSISSSCSSSASAMLRWTTRRIPIPVRYRPLLPTRFPAMSLNLQGVCSLISCHISQHATSHSMLRTLAVQRFRILCCSIWSMRNWQKTDWKRATPSRT